MAVYDHFYITGKKQLKTRSNGKSLYNFSKKVSRTQLNNKIINVSDLSIRWSLLLAQSLKDKTPNEVSTQRVVLIALEESENVKTGR